MSPIAPGLMLAVVIAAGIYGRQLETELAALKEQNQTELAALKKWDQDRTESLQRQILNLRRNVGEANGRTALLLASDARACGAGSLPQKVAIPKPYSIIEPENPIQK
jgi:hypothetical protein